MPSDSFTLVVSLDFELHWGMWPFRSLEETRQDLLGTREVIPRLLDLFRERGVHATWATVGLLLCADREELLARQPPVLPDYPREEDSPYHHALGIGRDEREDPFHFAPSLVRLIAGTPGQEIGTHTFSHFFCREPGYHTEAFRADLEAASTVSRAHGIALASLVFPKNQVSDPHLAECARTGLRAYRGSHPAWMYRPRRIDEHSPVTRAARLLDAYLPVARDHTGSASPPGPLRNVRASRLLRSYVPRFAAFEGLRLRRILGEIDAAARGGSTYHLWWHPEGFGRHPRENLDFLRRVLDHAAARGARFRNIGEAATAV